MSKKTKSRAPQSIHRATLPTGEQGGNFFILPESLVQLMINQQAPQKNASGKSMLPGAPLQPYEGFIPQTGPRVWDYPTGWNIGSGPGRQLLGDQQIPTFVQLRTLARSCDYIGLCVRAWLDMVEKLTLVIKPRAELIADGDDEDSKKYQKDISRYMTFFEKPDRRKDLHSWLRTAIIEQLEIDALSIYMHPTRGGGLYAMEIIDGASIKPLLDERGCPPAPPFPAYQQFLKQGIPGALLTSSQLLYTCEFPRSDSPYGMSRVELIIMKVNQTLRKQQKDLARFTDGNIPPGFLEPPLSEVEWSPDDLAAYQTMFDALIAGNAKMQARIRVIPPGSKYTSTEEPDPMLDFERFLLNVACAAFGLSMADLGFTEDVNRSSGESQENMTYRRTLQPLMNRYAGMFTQVLRDYFGEDRFVVSFGGYEESEDLDMLSNAYSRLVAGGIVSASDAARRLRLPVQCEVPTFVMTSSGPIFLEDLIDPVMRQAQKKAQLAGLELAAQPAPPAAVRGEPSKIGESNSSVPRPSEPSKKAASSKAETSNEEDESEEQEEKPQRSADYRRWRGRALEDVKADRPLRNFTTTLIAEPEHHIISQALLRCVTPDEVRDVFRAAMVGKLLHWQDIDKEIQKQVRSLAEQGVTYVQWQSLKNACDVCQRNDAKTVKLGERFISGAFLPPEHNHCECKIIEIRGEP